ncbi:hypothetical protein GG344DRAFT_82192 [Lentinula edodes]|nr:hypothetical protein GG344DRAFT_82192 [Lentinula edodes]
MRDADPENDLFSYDKWMYWALETICDWPKNLFQGLSAGDGAGTKVDISSDKPGDTTPALKKLVWNWGSIFMVCLNIGLYDVDDPLADHEKYEPAENEWYMP